MIGIDALAGTDAREAVKSAAPGVVDLVWDAATGKKKEEPKAPPQDKPKSEPKGEGSSFLSKSLIGPIKIWHSLAAGALAAGGGVLWWKLGKKS